MENFFDRLEDSYDLSIANTPAYTVDQMTGKAKKAIQTMDLFNTAILKWNGFDDVNQT